MYQLSCGEIWGGIRNCDEDIASADLTASLYSFASDGGKGGDIYYLSLCENNMHTRMVIADVTGHGENVSRISKVICQTIKSHMNNSKGDKLLSELNQTALKIGLDAMTKVVMYALKHLTTWIVSLCFILFGSIFGITWHLPRAEGASTTERQETTLGVIERLDPRIDQLVSADAAVEVLADGFTWLEGPTWNKKEGTLFFSDIPNNSVYKWHPRKGVSLFLKPSGYTGDKPFEGREPGSNGLTFDLKGRLVLCEHGDRRITRLEPDGNKTVLVDRYQGKRLNSPNDVVFKSDGSMYFTDPPFGLPKTFDDPEKELDFSGVYRMSPGGDLMLLLSEIKAPNGIAFSPDEKTLYLTDVDLERSAWLAFPVLGKGTLGQGRVFHDATRWKKMRSGGPDGLKVDIHGNLYGAGPEAVYIFAPDGTHLGSIFTGVPTGNLTWGDDGFSLYITAETRLLRIRLNTKGAGF